MFTSMHHQQRVSVISLGSSHYVHTLLVLLSSPVYFFTLDFITANLHVRNRVSALFGLKPPIALLSLAQMYHLPPANGRWI